MKIAFQHIFTGIWMLCVASDAVSAEKALTGLVNSCSNIAIIKDDVGDYMINYLKQHFVPTATRLSQCCTMATATFTGTSADSGVIVGVENNTDQRFAIMQNNSAIGMLERGTNSVALHLASLLTSAGATSRTADITFVPVSGAQTAKVRVRVLSGLQLTTYIQNSASAQGTTFLKNGNNPLPGAGQEATTQGDQYLVVETVALDASNPLASIEQRIQTLNLSNITNLYTLTLEINTMGLAFEPKGTASGSTTLTVDTVSEYASLNDVYLASIKGVHILNEVPVNTVPLIILPRNIWQAGTPLNKLYAAYIQAYANFISKKNAGSASAYYDLSINYSFEPYAYLHALRYFDAKKSLVAVVDQAVTLASGIVIGNMIGTDVYAANLALSSDLSLVQVAQDASGNLVFDPEYEHLIFGFDFKSTTFFDVDNAMSGSGPDALSPGSTATFPSNLIGNAFFSAMSKGSIGIDWHALTGPSYQGFLMGGNPASVTVNTSYNVVGSFPSAFWMLSQADWVVGIRIVPVIYDVNTSAPLLQTQDLNSSITSTKQVALYFYAFKATTGEFIGVLPVLNGVAPLQASSYCNLIQLTSSIMASAAFQASNYEGYGTAIPSMSGLVNSPGGAIIEYPGDGYLSFDFAGKAMSLTRNKMSDMSLIRQLVQKAWSIDNNGSDLWMVSVPTAAMKAGISVQVNRLEPQVYDIILYDKDKNILGFKQFATTENNPTLGVEHIMSTGKSVWHNNPVKIQAASSAFTIKIPSTKAQKKVAATPMGISVSSIALSTAQLGPTGAFTGNTPLQKVSVTLPLKDPINPIPASVVGGLKFINAGLMTAKQDKWLVFSFDNSIISQLPPKLLSEGLYISTDLSIVDNKQQVMVLLSDKQGTVYAFGSQTIAEGVLYANIGFNMNNTGNKITPEKTFVNVVPLLLGRPVVYKQSLATVPTAPYMVPAIVGKVSTVGELDFYPSSSKG